MRCKSCNNELKDHESHWKADIGEFECMCVKCRRHSRIESVADDRSDCKVICDSLDIPTPTKEVY